MYFWLPTISIHSLVVVVSVLAYILTTRAERERRRPPSIAIAWVLGMIALPYLVLPMYLLFGRRKLPRKKLRRSGARSFAGHWAQDLIESFGLPASSAASTQMHRDGGESAAALFSTIAGAISRLDVCTYILGDDAFGRETMQRMIEKAQGGGSQTAAGWCRRNSTAERLLRNLAPRRRRDRDFQSAIRAPHARAAQLAQPSQNGDRRCSATMGGRTQSRG